MFGPVLLLVFGRRAWCRHLCPIGALLKLFGSGCVGKVRLVNDECIACGKCNHTCDMLVDVMGELKTHAEVRSLSCVRCLKCIDECPTGAIAFCLSVLPCSRRDRREASLSPDAATRAERTTLKRRRISAFDVAITALWIGVTVIFAFSGARQNAPQQIRAVMTPGLLLVIYGLVWVVHRVWSRSEVKKQEIR
jgi:Fe-S-cluster-containing hydrogenase component 2